MIEKELKIRDACGDYALDIPFADGSVKTIYFNSKRNAETVKHIIEVDGSKLNEATVREMEEIMHGKKMTNFEKIKSMSKEQMTHFVLDALNNDVCDYCKNCNTSCLEDEDCLENEEIIKKWLESEADSD